MLKEMFAEIGENCYIEPPFHSNFGGKRCHFGNDVYAYLPQPDTQYFPN